MSNKELDFDKYLDQLRRTSISSEDRKIKEVFGDLFACPDEYSLAHCVAEDLSMGKGIAKAFKSKFKEVESLKGQRRKAGGVATLEVGDKRFIYYLVTKKESTAKPTYSSLHKSITGMKEHMVENDIKKLAMPRIGCGLDRLEWRDVSLILEDIFKDVTCDIVVYNNREFENKKSDKPNQKKGKKDNKSKKR
ncbi:O-acetyl-ADP-ribose deacetylase 1-like [Ctenocephalides felis]|uniref:O-acetyl-ADP-ribose deacetylase 1-like n=1 Tax=Ctenocephalides felis TaxID=7515 RepID=UPI000E6E531B|nr:O-acetyl-ADP-ribose deacetylase 1-like [Ctenocephalides felis]